MTPGWLRRSLGLRRRPAPPASDRIALPRPIEPVASVIVLAWRQVELLERCLRSLAEHDTEVPFETILVLNGASQEVRHLVANRVRGAILVSSPVNLGFSGGNNLGATVARGEHLVLLNDDAEVRPGWLEHLVEAAADPQVGAAASCVLFEDGTVQDAGGIVWRDGLTSVIGRGHPVEHALLAGRRRVHYASGCSLLVPRLVWDLVRGLDEGYVPAYYEDVDLCLSLAREGLDVVVEPRSQIVHRESASVDPRHKAFLFARNRQRLLDRWDTVLAEHPSRDELGPEPERRVARTLQHPPGARSVLFIDDRAPHPSGGSGQPRMLEALLELAAQPGVRLVFGPGPRRVPAAEVALANLGIAVVEEPIEAHLVDPDEHYDLVLISRPDNFERYAGLVRLHHPGAILVYDCEALYHWRIILEAQLEADPLRQADLQRHARRFEALERRIRGGCDQVITLSSDERDWWDEQAGTAPVTFVVPLLPEWSLGERAWAERRSAVFVAGWVAGAESPNGDGMRWLHDEVLLVARSLAPEVEVGVTGGDLPGDLPELLGPGLVTLGDVDDLSALYHQARVAVSPTRYGAGVKNKVVEALQHGVPVVATTVGAEGLPPDLRSLVVVADDPADFAQHLAELTTDEDTWTAHRARIEAVAEERAAQPRQSIATVVAARLATDRLDAERAGTASRRPRLRRRPLSAPLIDDDPVAHSQRLAAQIKQVQEEYVAALERGEVVAPPEPTPVAPTSVGEDDRWPFRLSPTAVLGLAALLASLLRLWAVGGVDVPIVFDEIGYIGNAQHLAGEGPGVVMTGTFYSVGAAVPLVPLLWLTSSPTALHTAGVLGNIALLALLPFLLYAVLRRLGASRSGSTAGALVALASVSLTANAAVLWSETLLVLALPAWLLALGALRRDSRPWAPAVLALASVALYAIHGRAIVLMAFGFLVLLVAPVLGRARPIPVVAGLASGALALLAVRAANSALADALYRNDSDRLATGFVDRLRWEDVDSYLRAGVGHGWYALVASLGLIVPGLWMLARTTWAERTALARAPEPGRADPLVALAVLASAALALGVSVVWTGSGLGRMARGDVVAERSDLLAYGRYIDFTVVLLGAVGVAWLVDRQSWRPRVAAGGAAALVLVAGGMGLGRIFPSDWFGLFFNPSTSPALLGWIEVVGSFSPVRISLVVAVIVILVVAVAARPRPGVVVGLAVLVVVNVGLTVVLADEQIRPAADRSRALAAVPTAVNDRAVEAIAVLPPYNDAAFYLYQFWLTDAGYELVSEAELAAPGRDLVIGPLDWEPPAGIDAVLVVDDPALGRALWEIEEGETDAVTDP